MISAKTLDRKRLDELKKISSTTVATHTGDYKTELEKLCAFANTFVGYLLEEFDKELTATEAARRRQAGIDKVLDRAHGRSGNDLPGSV